MSFMIDQNDQVWQANLGEESATKAQAITHFAPIQQRDGSRSINKNARLRDSNRALYV